MKYEEMKNLVENIIENELNKVQLYKEIEFEKEEGQVFLEKDIENRHKKLLSKLNEDGQKELREYEDLLLNKRCEISRFYYNEGVRAGLTDLDFLHDIVNSYTLL